MSVRALADAWVYDGNDPGIVLFSEALKAWRFDLPEGARVLELGCCESDLAATLLKARPDVQITGIDVRPCPGYPGTFVQADAASLIWGASFDAVVGIGSIEHFGLGWHEYGDPMNVSGDRLALNEAAKALTVDGLIYYDVPYTPQTSFVTGHYRVYDDHDVNIRLTPDGCIERARGWAPNASEHDFTQVRPMAPHSPFWFTARWLTKVA